MVKSMIDRRACQTVERLRSGLSQPGQESAVGRIEVEERGRSCLRRHSRGGRFDRRRDGRARAAPDVVVVGSAGTAERVGMAARGAPGMARQAKRREEHNGQGRARAVVS